MAYRAIALKQTILLIATMVNNGNYPQLEIDPDTGRPLKAVYPIAGGVLFWYADGNLPVVKHVVKQLPGK